MQQPMQNSEDISDPTIAIDMALVLMAKAVTLNNHTPTNNNQRSSLISTDISKIARKQSKSGKHGHENQKSTKRSQRIKA
ncbi:hypothetical protein Tco_0638096, partial [Tanacetum coccineum]